MIAQYCPVNNIATLWGCALHRRRLVVHGHGRRRVRGTTRTWTTSSKKKKIHKSVRTARFAVEKSAVAKRRWKTHRKSSRRACVHARVCVCVCTRVRLCVCCVCVCVWAGRSRLLWYELNSLCRLRTVFVGDRSGAGRGNGREYYRV